MTQQKLYVYIGRCVFMRVCVFDVNQKIVVTKFSQVKDPDQKDIDDK